VRQLFILVLDFARPRSIPHAHTSPYHAVLALLL